MVLYELLKRHLVCEFLRNIKAVYQTLRPAPYLPRATRVWRQLGFAVLDAGRWTVVFCYLWRRPVFMNSAEHYVIATAQGLRSFFQAVPVPAGR
jgi:hypothetical protein